MADPNRDVEPNGAHAFVLPPRHRLFAIFDDADTGRQAVEELRREGFAQPDDLWVFYGEEGLRSLELRGSSHRLRMKVVRIVQRAMTSDFNYLQVLDGALRQGEMVVAVRVHDGLRARTGSRSRCAARSAHSFAYGAHWDFVPVAA